MAMCDSTSNRVDYESAYMRCIQRKKPESDLERWVNENATAFNVRQMSDKDARVFHKRKMVQAEKLQEEGKLFVREPILDSSKLIESTVFKDVERELIDLEKTQPSLAKRLAALREAQKNQ